MAQRPRTRAAANYVVTNAIALPSLGRNLSSGNVTVNLVEPGTLYGARINNIDMRIAKILRFRGTRAQFGVDIYNLLNTDVVTAVQQRLQPDRRVAHADGDPAGALRPFQHAVRFLIQTGIRDQGPGIRDRVTGIRSPWSRVPDPESLSCIVRACSACFAIWFSTKPGPAPPC